VINNIFLFGRVVRFIVHTKFDDGRVDRKNFINISDDSARKKQKKRSGRVGLAELVLAELSGNPSNLLFHYESVHFNYFVKQNNRASGISDFFMVPL
jgi:hypothetical protein